MLLLLLLFVIVAGCQKMDRPALGDYPKDANPPGGPLKFYVAFDGTETNPIFNAVDSIRANYPSLNTMKTIDGVIGKAVQGELGKEIKYPSANEWAASSSFAVAFWMKHNVAPEKEAQFIFSIPSTVGHWSNATMFLFLDHKGAGTTLSNAVMKFFVVDSKGEKWFEFNGAKSITNLLDNSWHHLVFSYDESTSVMTLYKDGVVFNTIDWAGHGKISIVTDKVSGFKIAGKTTDWGETWQGGLDQFRLYGKALSAAEVTELFSGKK